MTPESDLQFAKYYAQGAERRGQQVREYMAARGAKAQSAGELRDLLDVMQRPDHDRVGRWSGGALSAVCAGSVLKGSMVEDPIIAIGHAINVTKPRQRSAGSNVMLPPDAYDRITKQGTCRFVRGVGEPSADSDYVTRDLSSTHA